jgi:DNA-binding MarR family transcriptional regulator
MDDIRVDFLFNLYFIGRKVRGHYKQENKDLMLTAAILHLLQKQEYTLSHLAKIMYSKLSSLSEKISALEGEGLVKKGSKDGDERELYISLTTVGRKKVEKTLEIMKLHCMEFTKGVSDEELKHVNPILKKMVA